MDRRPNLLFIFTDQQSASMLGCAGNPFLHTPAMDSLAARGVRFERAYCTNPVCLPSRFSLLTGRRPSYAGIRSNEWQRESKGVPGEILHQGLGAAFRAVGYDAAYGGKVHLPGFGPADLGFEVLTDDDRQGLTDACAAYVRTHGRERPFFLVTSYINPHDICFMAIGDDSAQFEVQFRQFAETHHIPQREIENFMAGPRTLQDVLRAAESIDPSDFETTCPPLPPNFEPQADEPQAMDILLDQRTFRRSARTNYDEARWRLHRWAYARLTEQVDREIGGLLDALEESGQAENTVVFFTSDHGDHDGAHRLEHKDTLYEESCGIPLVIADLRPDGCRAAVDALHLVSNGLDLLPTFCDYAGIQPPAADLEGRSLRPLVERGETDGWRTVLPVESEFGRGLVTERYKYVRYFEGKNREQLYDREERPPEMRNAARDPDKRGILESLRTEFTMWFSDGI